MRGCSWGTFLPVLAACSGGGSAPGYFGSPSCEFAIADWFDDPLLSAHQADAGGDFSFDPPGDAAKKREGAYGFDSGDLAWTTTYAEGYFLSADEGEGYGTISGNGDLDLLYAFTSTDVLGIAATTRVRTERTGCQGTTIRTDLEPGQSYDDAPAANAYRSAWDTTIVSADEVDQVLSDVTFDGDLQETLVSKSDGSTTDTMALSDADLESYDLVTKGSSDGTASGTFEQVPVASDTYFAGSFDRAFDGSEHWVYDVLDLATDEVQVHWDYDESYTGLDGSVPPVRDGTLGYLGSGGTWYDCTYHDDADSCVYTCDYGAGPVDQAC